MICEHVEHLQRASPTTAVNTSLGTVLHSQVKDAPHSDICMAKNNGILGEVLSFFSSCHHYKIPGIHRDLVVLFVCSVSK